MKWEFSFPWSQDPNKAFKEKMQSSMDQAQMQQMQSYLDPLKALIPQYNQRYAQATSDIGNLFSNAPQLNLADYSKSLTGLSSDLSTLGKGISSNLSNISKTTTGNVNKYLGSTSDYIKSLLNETKTGTSQYLKGYQELAKGNMPGLNIYNEQNAANTATSIQALRNLGIDSSSALTSILNNNQNTGANIALQAAQYKTQAQQNLADAVLKAGTTNAGAFTTAANLEQQNASLAQNLGQFNAGISEANAGIQSNILGAKANITGQQAGFAKDQYNAQVNDWLANLQWNETQATANDPLAFENQLYSQQAGMDFSVAQTQALANQQSLQAQQQNKIQEAAIIAKLIAGIK